MVFLWGWEAIDILFLGGENFMDWYAMGYEYRRS